MKICHGQYEIMSWKFYKVIKGAAFSKFIIKKQNNYNQKTLKQKMVEASKQWFSDMYTQFTSDKKDAVMEDAAQPINQPDSIEDNLFTAEQDKAEAIEEVKTAHAQTNP